MKNSINLLIKKDEQAERSMNRYRGLRMTAFVALFTVSLITTVLLILIAASPLPALQQVKNEELGKIAAYHPKMAKLLLVQERLKSIQGVINQRGALDKQISWLSDTVPSSLTIQSYSVDQKKVALVLEGNSLDQFQSFFTNLGTLADTHNTIKNASMDSITFNTAKGLYNVSVTIELL